MAALAAREPIMFQGRLLAICIGRLRGGAMERVDRVELGTGQGIVGDRYSHDLGGKPTEEVTLIEQEALNAALRDCQLELAHVDCRRNLLTSGVPLNHLVGKRFRVGAAVLEGIELCEPCSHLERLTGKKIVKALLHRGGLRARIIEGGTIQPGDQITAMESE